MSTTEAIPSELDEELRRLARSCSTNNYKAVAERCNIGSHEKQFGSLVKLLTVVNEREFNEGRPLLAAVVVNKKTKMPGAGFFKWARDHILIEGTGREFWEAELKRVCAYSADRDRSPTEKFGISSHQPMEKPLTRQSMSPMALIRVLFARL